MPAFKYIGEETKNTTRTRPDDESTPLISTSGSSTIQESVTGTTLLHNSSSSLHSRNTSTSTSSSSPSDIFSGDIIFHSSDESGGWFLDFIMEKVKNTKIGYWADKLAVDAEPGLTNAQLMLNNHDLKPGE